MQRVTVGGGLAIGVVLGGSLQAQTSDGTAASLSRLHTPSSGQMTDGTQVYTSPESTADGVLREMAGRAAIIFTGTVSAVRTITEDELRGNAAASIVEVDFVVDHAVRGVAEGTTYTMREWAGLWRDSPRFAVGQRVLALLHGAGPSGLSSPVDGLDGVIPIKATDAPTDTSFNSLASSAAVPTSQEDAVDMRWLQARTLRTQTLSDTPTASPGENLAGGLLSTQTAGILVASGSSAAAHPATSAGLSHVLGLLTALRETPNASH